MLNATSAISPAQLEAGQRALVLDLAWASLTGAFSGGVILVAFALALGASPLVVGLLAAIPFIAQGAQLPATLLVERWRVRKRIGVLAISASRGLILLTAALPFVPDPAVALGLLIAAQVAIALLGAVGGCAVNSWFHQLIPPDRLGGFFSRRLFWGTTLACVGTLLAGLLVERRDGDSGLTPYAWAFAIAAMAGFVSSFFMARAPEPVMTSGPPAPMRERLARPFQDTNFRALLLFQGAWTVAANLAAPFLTVYLMEQMGYGLGTVTQLWVTSQLANAFTLYLWGRLSDRLSNKAVLAVVLPVHFACVAALVFADEVDSPGLRLGLLYAIHAVMGVATGGIGLATGNLSLKLAPQGEGTAYLAAIGLVCAVCGGAAPLVAGALAQALQSHEVSAVIRWATPEGRGEMAVLGFAHWEFLFMVSVGLGLYVLHTLSRIREGREVSERLVVQEFALEALRSLGSLSSVGGALGSLFPFERLNERRKWWRARSPRGSP